MRRFIATLMAVLVVVGVSACGGDSADDTREGTGDEASADPAGDADDLDQRSGGGESNLSPGAENFDLASLPGDFDRSLVPPEWHAGEVGTLGTVTAVNFESNMSFADTVAHYTDLLGPATFDSAESGGDDDSRLVQWTRPDDYTVVILDEDPTTIGFSSVDQ